MRRTACLIFALGFAASALLADDHAGAPLASVGGLVVSDGYATSYGPSAPTGAAYFQVSNDGPAADRLVAVESPAARRTEMHATEIVDGVARMTPLEAVEIAPGATAMFERGGAHVMLMGLVAPLEDGAAVELTLIFEGAGPVPLSLPVRRDARAGQDAGDGEHAGH